MKKLLIGLLIGICLPLIGGFLFILAGGMPVATKGPPLPMEQFIAQTAIHAAMRGQSDMKSPVEFNDLNLIAGAKVYKTNCAVCHGLPDGDETAIAKGMFPQPPQLFGEDNVTDDPPGKIFWKVKNGIRLTGMPGFDGALNETELWQVSVLLQSVDKLSDAVKAELAGK